MILCRACTQLPDMAAERSEDSEERFEVSDLPSEQELLEGMQAVQAAVAAAEEEQGDAGILAPQPDSKPSTPGEASLYIFIAIPSHRSKLQVAAILDGIALRSADRCWLRPRHLCRHGGAGHGHGSRVRLQLTARA